MTASRNAAATLSAAFLVLGLAACAKQDEPEPAATETATVAPMPVEPAPADTIPPAPATSAIPEAMHSAANEALPTTIPAAIQGRWGLVPKDCTSTAGDAKGLLTVSATQLKFYESVAKLGKVAEGDESRIKASFTYSGEGQSWVHTVVLDVQDGGRTLTRRNYGPDAAPAALKYTRCG